MARPVAVLLPVLAVILLAGSPFLHLRLANGDVDMLPPSAESRVAYHTLLEQFPGQDQNQFQVVVHYTNGTDPLGADNLNTLYYLSPNVSPIPSLPPSPSLL